MFLSRVEPHRYQIESDDLVLVEFFPHSNVHSKDCVRKGHGASCDKQHNAVNDSGPSILILSHMRLEFCPHSPWVFLFAKRETLSTSD